MDFTETWWEDEEWAEEVSTKRGKYEGVDLSWATLVLILQITMGLTLWFKGSKNPWKHITLSWSLFPSDNTQKMYLAASSMTKTHTLFFYAYAFSLDNFRNLNPQENKWITVHFDFLQTSDNNRICRDLMLWCCCRIGRRSDNDENVSSLLTLDCI